MKSETITSSLDKHPLLKNGVSIDIQFSFETSKWDFQLRGEATVKADLEVEKITRISNCVEIDKSFLLFPDNPLEGFEGAVGTEFTIVWTNLMRAIQRHLERQGLLMDNDALHEYMQDIQARQKAYRKHREEKKLAASHEDEMEELMLEHAHREDTPG